MVCEAESCWQETAEEQRPVGVGGRWGMLKRREAVGGVSLFLQCRGALAIIFGVIAALHSEKGS